MHIDWNVVAPFTIGGMLALALLGMSIYETPKKRREKAFHRWFWTAPEGPWRGTAIKALLEQLGQNLSGMTLEACTGTRPDSWRKALKRANHQLKESWKAARGMGFYVGDSHLDWLPTY